MEPLCLARLECAVHREARLKRPTPQRAARNELGPAAGQGAQPRRSPGRSCPHSEAPLGCPPDYEHRNGSLSRSEGSAALPSTSSEAVPCAQSVS